MIAALLLCWTLQAGWGARSHLSTDRLEVHVGSVIRLYPGKHVPLPVRIGNPVGHAIVVTAAKVRVFGVEGCRRKRFFTGTRDFTPDVRIAAHGTWQTTLPFGLRFTARNGCQGKSFSVRVRAWADAP
ncbi:MAG: hypothetical protein ACR2GB_02705 [Nocardioidaceae bacterium]